MKGRRSSSIENSSLLPSFSRTLCQNFSIFLSFSVTTGSTLQSGAPVTKDRLQTVATRTEMLLIFLSVFTAGSAKLSFKSQRFFNLGGKEYTETLTQPWFRHMHQPHLPIPNAIVNQTTYGKHAIPEDDVFVPHEWLPEEKKYLPCRNMTCVCPFFEGKVVGAKCILPNGKQLRRTVRKEIRTLTDVERGLVHNAFLKMKADGVYDRVGFVHKYSGVHEGPGFFTWHREYLKRTELLWRKYLPMGSNLGFPYWDSSMDAYLPNPAESIFFAEHFVGDTDENDLVSTGPYKDWKIMEGTRRVIRYVGQRDQGELLTDARIDFVMNQKNISQVLAPVIPLESCPMIVRDDRLFEYSHDYVHDFINGDMKEAYSSSSEISFTFHHVMVDHLWEMWRQRNQDRLQRETQYPPSIADCYPKKHFADAKMTELEPYTNKDVLSNEYTDNMYTYAPRPTCVDSDAQCGSKFLFCYTGDWYPKCLAKVRLGGSCHGYEKYDVCFDGVCEQGQCRQRSLRQAMNPSFIFM